MWHDGDVETLLNELRAGLPTGEETARIVIRLVAAAVVGGIAGIDRERVGKAAGLRTHMLVAMGAAVFVLTAQLSALGGQMGTVIQGVAAGIGFIGGGAILKSTQNKEIHGLTTAAGIWMTAAAGLAAGLGHLVLALLVSLMGLLILNVLTRAEAWMGTDGSNRA